MVAATTAACGKDGAPVGQSSNSLECRARVDASRRARGVTRIFLFFPSIANARRRAIASPRPRARSNDTRHSAIPTADRAIRVTAGDRRAHLLDVFHGRDRLGGDGLLRDRGLGDDANAGEGGGKGRHDECDRFVLESDDARARAGDRPTERRRSTRAYVCVRARWACVCECMGCHGLETCMCMMHVMCIHSQGIRTLSRYFLCRVCRVLRRRGRSVGRWTVGRSAAGRRGL